jgi:hypothetical protein
MWVRITANAEKYAVVWAVSFAVSVAGIVLIAHLIRGDAETPEATPTPPPVIEFLSPSPSPTITVSPSPPPTPTIAPMPPPSPIPEPQPIVQDNMMVVLSALHDIADRLGYSKINWDNRVMEDIIHDTLDLNGDGIADNIEIIARYAEGADTYNFVDVLVSVNDATHGLYHVFTSGVVIEIVNFNECDPYLDIYINISGTDVDGQGVILRYDGETIYEYARFRLTMGLIAFGGDGFIYHLGYDGEGMTTLFRLCVTTHEVGRVDNPALLLLPRHDAAGINPAAALRLALESHEGVSSYAIEAFFRYYAKNSVELWFLPSFTAETMLHWSDLLHFAFFHLRNMEFVNNAFFMPKAEVDNVIRHFSLRLNISIAQLPSSHIVKESAMPLAASACMDIHIFGWYHLAKIMMSGRLCWIASISTSLTLNNRKNGIA